MIQWFLLFGAFLGGMWIAGFGPDPSPQAPVHCPPPPPKKKCTTNKDLEGVIEKFQNEVFYCVLEKQVITNKCEECFKVLGEIRNDYIDCLNTKYD